MSKNIRMIPAVVVTFLWVSIISQQTWEQAGRYYYPQVSVDQKGKTFSPEGTSVGIQALLMLSDLRDTELVTVVSAVRRHAQITAVQQHSHFATPLRYVEVRELLIIRFAEKWAVAYGFSEDDTRNLVYQGCNWVVRDLYGLDPLLLSTELATLQWQAFLFVKYLLKYIGKPLKK